MPKQQILQYSSENWRVSERTFENYWKKATDIIRAVAREEDTEVIKDYLYQLDQMSFDAWKEKRYSEAIQAMKERHKLKGLYPAEKTEHQLTGKDGEDLTFEVIIKDAENRN